LSASLDLVTPQLLPYTEPANEPMLVNASAETPLCSSAKTHSLATDPDETPLIVADLDIAPVHRAKAVPSAADPDPAVVDVDPVDAAEALPPLPPAADPDPVIADVDPVDAAEALPPAADPDPAVANVDPVDEAEAAPPAADPVDTEVMDAAAVSPTATLASVICAAIAAPMTDEFFDSQLYSSCCSCGNCTLLLYAVKPLPIDVIEHKFLVKGHMMMECDSMHSAIEYAQKNLTICSLHEWYNVLRSARRHRPYCVEMMNYTDFFLNAWQNKCLQIATNCLMEAVLTGYQFVLCVWRKPIPIRFS